MEIIRRVTVSLAAVVLSTVGIIAVGASPAAAASCSGSSCLHQDPSATGCTNGATTLTSFRYSDPWTSYDPLIELRYSSTCKAAWTRVTDGDCQPWACSGVIEASVNKSTIAHWSTSPAPHPNAQVWSNMMPFSYWVRACFVTWSDEGQPYQRVACTAWR